MSCQVFGGVRNHSTRKYERASNRKIYPAGTIYVLRYAGKWETLPEGTTWTEATVAALSKQTGFMLGKEPEPAPKPKPQKNAPLEEALDAYLAKVETLKKSQDVLNLRLGPAVLRPHLRLQIVRANLEVNT